MRQHSIRTHSRANNPPPIRKNGYAGFVCGYKAAQMDARDQGKKAPQAPKIPRTMPRMYHDDDKENTLPF